MKARIRTNPRIANDNGKPADVISVTARREDAARQGSHMREWAPAILATFFTVDCGSTSGPRAVAASVRGRRSAKR